MTKQSPFFVDHGYHPYTGIELQRDQVPSATELVNRLSKARQEVEAALALAKAAMKQQFDKHHSESWDYKPRDLVWLEGTNIKTQWPAKKLDHLPHGPFIITEKVGQAAYQLKLLQTLTWRCKHDVFNEKLLKPFIKPSFDIQPDDPPAPPDLVEEEEEYEVEAILDSCKKGRYIEYLVKWKGYSDAENSWEPCGNVCHAEEEVNQCSNSQRHHGDHDLKGRVMLWFQSFSTQTSAYPFQYHPISPTLSDNHPIFSFHSYITLSLHFISDLSASDSLSRGTLHR